mgnify:FL=1
MAVGTYGITRPADVSIDDIDIYYNYTPNRETFNDVIYKLNANEILSYNILPDEDKIDGSDNILEGLYNLKLPASVFNKLGIYTIYIKPKRIVTTIVDCGVLSSLSNVRGIVLDANQLPDGLKSNNALQGYRIEYIDTLTNKKIRNLSRFVVTSNKVIPVVDNGNGASEKSTRYKFDDSSNLLFLQLTPSSSSDIKSNLLPFIGTANQKIIISNTFFSPVVLEIDLVANTIDTLTDLVGGEVIKDIDNGIITYFDSNRNITRQFNVYEIKDDFGNVSLFEVKERRTNIDESQDFDVVTNGI